MGNLTHYRKVFKSDHLGIADLEDMIENNTQLVFTITHVKQELGVMVAGRKGNHNIAYFKENIKPLVLNATNSKIIKKFANGSAFVEHWQNIIIQLYIDSSVRMKGEIVGGVRINPQQPKNTRQQITQSNQKSWEMAKTAYKRDGNFKAIEVRADITDANKKLIVGECDNA